ncbi:MAG: hypothetical protein ACTHMY_18045 [Solirubrobacteraceae bacterium]
MSATAIALDLHVSRKTVRLARGHLGIPSLPPGWRARPLRVVPPAGHERQRGEIVLTGTALAIIGRFRDEQLRRTPATDGLAKRIRGYSQAQLNGDELAAEDALLAERERRRAHPPASAQAADSMSDRRGRFRSPAGPLYFLKCRE